MRNRPRHRRAPGPITAQAVPHRAAASLPRPRTARPRPAAGNAPVPGPGRTRLADRNGPCCTSGGSWVARNHASAHGGSMEFPYAPKSLCSRQPLAGCLSGLPERLRPPFHRHVSACPAAHDAGPADHGRPLQPEHLLFFAALRGLHALLGPAQRQIRPQARALHGRPALCGLQPVPGPGPVHLAPAVLARRAGRRQRRHQRHGPGHRQGRAARPGHGKSHHLDPDHHHPGAHAGPGHRRGPAGRHRLARHLRLPAALRPAGRCRDAAAARDHAPPGAGQRLPHPGASAGRPAAPGLPLPAAALFRHQHALHGLSGPFLLYLPGPVRALAPGLQPVLRLQCGHEHAGPAGA